MTLDTTKEYVFRPNALELLKAAIPHWHEQGRIDEFRRIRGRSFRLYKSGYPSFYIKEYGRNDFYCLKDARGEVESGFMWPSECFSPLISNTSTKGKVVVRAL